ncbi:hypothetical protein BKH46_07750 [Helicobacter sp. 12S02634-8]|uniref:hypothetical protein n=1 Tax=Helicobacter sp. 12S02634-8 TaxID=1476199 RepID=UPI000BA60DCF|nr:hypothetical protein [Helicobacter sp. 12S02634-8]PAF46354.1 hypothetical protein BKH46_07750 [Helicobacter sp. 12S02634-8]
MPHNLYNGGIDTAIFSPNASTLYTYNLKAQTEVFSCGDVFAVRSLGCFWFHLGMDKRGILPQGIYGQDHITLKEYLHSHKKDLHAKIKLVAIHNSDKIHHWSNFCWHFDKDKHYIKAFLSQNTQIRDMT